MPVLRSLPNVLPGQRQVIGVDLGDLLPTGVTLLGTPTVTLRATQGVDAVAQSRVTMGPYVGTVAVADGGSGRTNGAVLLQVTGCLPLVTYLVEVLCDRSDGDVVDASTRFTCVPAT